MVGSEGLDDLVSAAAGCSSPGPSSFLSADTREVFDTGSSSLSASLSGAATVKAGFSALSADAGGAFSGPWDVSSDSPSFSADGKAFPGFSVAAAGFFFASSDTGDASSTDSSFVISAGTREAFWDVSAGSFSSFSAGTREAAFSSGLSDVSSMESSSPDAAVWSRNDTDLPLGGVPLGLMAAMAEDFGADGNDSDADVVPASDLASPLDFSGSEEDSAVEAADGGGAPAGEE